MIIVGAISGIQDYVFDISHSFGKQARRLRARSFLVQLLSDITLKRILKAVNASEADVLFAAAGKYGVQTSPLSAGELSEVKRVELDVSGWLSDKFGTLLSFSLVVEDPQSNDADAYKTVMERLARQKLNPLSSICVQNGRWTTSRLVLASHSPRVCQICKRQPAGEGGQCTLCAQDEALGERLPHARYVEVSSEPRPNSFGVAGAFVTLENVAPRGASIARSAGGTGNGETYFFDAKSILKQVPSGDRGVLDFDAIARCATGAPYLGILKMDVDSLGVEINRQLAEGGWFALKEFSGRLSRFFSIEIGRNLAQSKWQNIYVVYGGGDDLLVVGPWNTAFDFASHVRSAFKSSFQDNKLTISAGLAIIPPKFPILKAVQMAEEALTRSKTESFSGEAPKDQLTAFGQTWKWNNNQVISFSGKALADWTRGSEFERGWLQEILSLSLSSHTNSLSEARFEYQAIRKYLVSKSNGDRQVAEKRWIEFVRKDFSRKHTLETRYLQAILTYAILETRSEVRDGQ